MHKEQDNIFHIPDEDFIPKIYTLFLSTSSHLSISGHAGNEAKSCGELTKNLTAHMIQQLQNS